MNRNPITAVDDPGEFVYIECQIEKCPKIVKISAPTIPPMQTAYDFFIVIFAE